MNDALAVEVLARIEAEPEHWHQSWWALKTPCGTTYCFAGHAVLAAGKALVWDDHYGRLDADALASVTTDGEDVWVAAAEALDITTEQADVLFSLPTSLDRIYSWVAEASGLDVEVLRDKVRAANGK